MYIVLTYYQRLSVLKIYGRVPWWLTTVSAFRFQMCFRGYGCQSVYITPSLTPFRNSTASWMEPKLLSLDSRPALHPSFYFSLLPSVGAPSGQTSIYWGPRTDPWPCPPLMLSPLLEILPPFPLSLLPSMFHSKPV